LPQLRQKFSRLGCTEGNGNDGAAIGLWQIDRLETDLSQCSAEQAGEFAVALKDRVGAEVVREARSLYPATCTSHDEKARGIEAAIASSVSAAHGC
jgi:hypothetical protein